MRRPVIAGNWKMHKTIGESVAFVEKLKPLTRGIEHCEVVLAPPFTALRAVAGAAKGTRIAVAAQDVHWDKEGAHTG
ncbi:MAG: triose-phosphate isomerase, partial [Acidobacteria bacterium]